MPDTRAFRGRVRLLLSGALLFLPGAASGRAAHAERSVREWARCDGVADDSVAAAAAFAAAARRAFVLRIDCPLRLAIGQDISRPIFIDNGTTVVFSPHGSVTVDNIFQPAFVIANSRDITLDGWNIRYAGQIPLDPTAVPGFAAANADRRAPTRYPITSNFSRRTLTSWLVRNRGLRLPDSGATAEWHGKVALFTMVAILGQSTNVVIRNATITAPNASSPDRFVPVAISLASDYANGAVAQRGTDGALPPGLVIPSHITIDGLRLENYIFGVLGQLRDSTIRRVRAGRYSDLQGPGVPVGAWFPPPHLIYLRSRAPGRLANRNLVIADVVDRGPVVGAPRQRGGSAVSLKVGADDSLVDGYHSERSDGVLQPLSSVGLTIRNVTGRYDSAFSPQHEGVIRFVNGPYLRTRIENVEVSDVAPVTAYPPVAGPSNPTSHGIVVRNVLIHVRRATAAAAAAPRFARGSADSVDVRVVADAGRCSPSARRRRETPGHC